MGRTCPRLSAPEVRSPDFTIFLFLFYLNLTENLVQILYYFHKIIFIIILIIKKTD